MSIYDQRDTPAYRDDFYPFYDENLDKLWLPQHDQIVSDLVDKYQWYWYWMVSDSLSKQFAGYHYNKLMYYAITRAHDLGLTKKIRTPQNKKCPLCGHAFIENSLPFPLVRRLGVDHLDFCAPCLRDTLLRGTGKYRAKKQEIIEYLRELTSILERIPAQGFGEGIEDLHDIDYKKRVQLLRLFQNKPCIERIKKSFGSWLKALIEAGILENDTRETPRGTHTIAQDGHTCFSLGEKTIDDYLYKQGIPHQKEPAYPGTNFRADFLVENTFIEYFGLAGDSNYDLKINEKKEICRKKEIKLIEIYPKDLVNIEKLKKKLAELDK
jgi:hypothetical protein